MRNLLTVLTCFCLSSFAIAQSIQANGPTTFCEGGSVRLTVSGVGGTHTYQWTKDGTNIGSATASSLLVTASGSYNVTITPAVGAVTPVAVTANPKPIADFTFSNNACAESPVPFTSTITSGTAPFTYAWNFGDGGTSALQNPSHPFTAFGCGTSTFTVRLTVTDANGCTGTITKTITVKQVPNINMTDIANPGFAFSNCFKGPSAANPNFTIKLNFNSSSPPCVTNYTVDWGDGNVQNGLTAADFPLPHTYTRMDEFKLVVSATGTNGCTYSKSYQVVNQSNPSVGIANPGNTTGCAPIGFWFKLSGYESNSPGTLYRWDFGDGSPQVIWTTPVGVDSIFHEFTKSSCGQSNNQFTVKVTAKNGCDSTTGTVNNVRIYTKPTAILSGPSSTCVGVAARFPNNSIGGYNAGSQNCNTNTTYTWDFGDGSPLVTVSGNSSQLHTYTATGTYKVTLIAEGLFCGKDTTTQTICVTNTPTASFNLDKVAVCGPATITATNTSSTLINCAQANYQWTVTYAATNCGTVAGWSFAGNTNASSVDPSFAFTSPGTYTITLSIISGCGTITSTKTVVVKAPPRVSLAAISNACGATTFIPVATVTNCGSSPVTYAWVIDGGTPTTSANPGSLTFSTPGTHTITLTVENECGTATATRSFTVSAVPDLNSSPNQVFCPGTAVAAYNFAGTTTGATYTWSNNNTAIGLASGGSTAVIPAFTTTNAGTATLTLRATANGCTAQATYTITVNARPAAPSTSPITYCKDATATALTASGTTGYTFNWYTTPTGGTGSPTAPLPTTTSIGTTTYYVSQTNPATGCESTRTPLAVTVAALPVVASTSFTNPTSCGSNNGSITLTGLTPNNSYSVSYTLNGAPLTKSVLSNSSGNLVLSALASGLYDRITVAQSGCSSSPVGPITLADPNPPAVPVISSNNSPLCSGGTLTLTATGAPTGATYTWTTPSGTSVNGPTLTVTNAPSSASGTYSVKSVLNGCSSAVATTSVAVNPTPAPPTTGSNSPLCEGATLNLTANSSSGGVTYAWSGPGGFTSSEQNPTLVNVTAAASGTYTATASLGGCSSSQTTAVTVNLLPRISSATSVDPTGCNTSNGSISLNGLQPNTRYSVQYSKNGAAPTTVSLLASATGVVTITGIGAGTYTSITAATGSCTSNPQGPFVLTATTAPQAPVVTATGPVCSGETVQLSATSPTAGTFQWTGPNGFSSTQQNPVLPNAPASVSGVYTVTVTLNGCTSPAGQASVAVHPVPAAPGVTPVAYCLNDPATGLTATPAAGNALNWYTASSGGTALPAAPVPSTTTAGTTLYYVSQSNSTGCEGPRAALSVTVNPKPFISSSRYTDPFGCSPDNGVIVLEGLSANTTYIVQYSKNGSPLTASVRTDGTGSLTLVSLSPATYSGVSVRLSGCTSNSVGPFTLIQSNAVPATPKASAGAPVCAGSSLNLFANSTTAGVSYHWTGPAGFTSNQQNPVLATATAAASGRYYVWVQKDNCLSEKDSVNIVVDNQPPAPVVTSPVAYCEGQLAAPLAATASAGNTLLWYTSATSGAGNAATPTPTTATAGPQLFYATQKTGQGCESNRTAIIVTVHPNPHAAILAAAKECQGENITFTANVQSQETVRSWQWAFSNGFTATGSSVTYRFPVPGTYSVKLLATTTSGCSDSAFHTVQVQPAPTVRVGQDVNLCLGQSAQLKATGAATYQWTPVNNLSCATCAEPLATPTTTTQYIVEGRNTEGCRAYDTVNLTVYRPFRVSALGSDSICIGTSVQLSATGAARYQWSPAQGLSSVTAPNPTATPTTTTTYMLVGFDEQACFTDTAHLTVAVGNFPTVSLGPDLTLAAGTLQPLASTIRGGPIRTWSWTPTTNLSCSGCAVPVAEIKKDISYTVKATTPYGCSASDTINIKVFCEQSTVFVPNAFTPDGDGVNDVLMVRAKGVVSVKYFRIFNRWGELVFERSNFAPNNPQYGWDGKIRGVVGGPDVFVYTCEVTCENGASFTYKGNVSIIK